jgi:hypothetical protein
MASQAMRWDRVSKFGLGEKNRMLTRKSVFIAAIAGLVSLTFGCGGGSGTPATPAAGTLTRMISEDTFTFVVKGSSKYPTGSFSYSGTAVMIATDNVTLGSKSGLVKLTATTNLSFNGEPSSSVSDTWYSYDASGNILDVANKDSEDALFEQATPFLFLPATYSIGQSGSYTKTNADETTSTVTWEVHEKSVVTVPAGKFETFVVKVIDTQSDGVVTKTEYYVAPQLGYPVKLEVKITGPGGVSQSDEGVLKSYSAPLRG